MKKEIHLLERGRPAGVSLIRHQTRARNGGIGLVGQRAVLATPPDLTGSGAPAACGCDPRASGFGCEIRARLGDPQHCE